MYLCADGLLVVFLGVIRLAAKCWRLAVRQEGVWRSVVARRLTHGGVVVGPDQVAVDPLLGGRLSLMQMHRHLARLPTSLQPLYFRELGCVAASHHFAWFAALC